ncbi:MAG: Xaa-Pro peptidase family protein [Nitrososphaeria archaeon]
MTPKFLKRIESLQKLMNQKSIDLLVVNNRENLIYLTGLLEIECMAILIPKDSESMAVTLSQDAEYVQDKAGIKTIGYHFPKESLGSKLVELLSKSARKVSSIGFERYFVDYEVYEKLREVVNERIFVNASDIFYKARSVKDASEIELIKKASDIVLMGVDAAIQTIKPGVSELDVLAEAEYSMLKAGSYGSSFRPQIASGNRCLITHPVATDKKIQADETVIVSLGSTYQGYCSKISRTVYIGKIDDESKKVHDMLTTIQKRLIETVKPGISSDEIYSSAEKILKDFNYKRNFLEVLGYGIGIRQSEFYPIIGKARKDLLEPNMVISLLLPVVYGSDNKGFKLTDIIWIKDNHNEVLTKYPYEVSC